MFRKYMAHAMHPCRFCFCRYHGMVPLRFVPLAPYAISALVARFTAAADMKVLSRELRTGMVLGRIIQAQLHHNGQENRVAIAHAGQWSLNSSTYQTEYLHPSILHSLLGDLVRTSPQQLYGN